MKKTQKKEDDPKLNWKQNVVLYLHDLLHMMLFMIAVFLVAFRIIVVSGPSMYDTLLECAKIAEESGIQMNLEPLNITTDHVGNFLRTTRMAAEMTRLIGSPRLKVLYDVYHMQLNEGSICNNIRAYGDQFGHIHVADAPGRHEPGTGEINYANVFACLEACGYTGLVGFELIPKTTTAEAVKAIMKY